MMVRCPFCYRSFPHEEHPLQTRKCPDCSRHFYPSKPEELRCPTCEQKWADYRAQGGIDPRELESKDVPIIPVGKKDGEEES